MIEITCVFCEEDFQVKPYRTETAKYCSNLCRKEHKQALWTERQCMSCSKFFSLEAWKLNNSHKGSYCSLDCYRQRSPQKEIECICGTRFKAYQSRIFYYHRLFCSQKCYLKNGFFGRLTDDLPEVSNYGKFISKLRSTTKYLTWKQQCLERNRYICKCGVTEGLTVHHVISIYDLVKKHGLKQDEIEKDPIFYDLNNGETLCRSCHLEQHRRKDE